MRLGKQRRNEVFQAIVDGGLDPAGFEMSEGARKVHLVHTDTELFLTISDSDLRQIFAVAASVLSRTSERPGPYTVSWTTTGEPRVSVFASWEETTRQVQTWVEQVKEDLTTPDLWAALKNGSYAHSAGKPSDDNTPFNEEEQQEIVEQLEKLKQQAEAQGDLTGEQMRELAAKLDYLAAASTRVGRLDWRNLVAGTLLGVLSDAILPAETAHRVFSTLLNSVGHLLGHPVPLLPSP
jgi:hypothetical protein